MITILTGAGISAESGIPTFRGAGGVWREVRVEEVASPEAFAQDPEFVHAFYNERRSKLLNGNILPHAGHQALAHLERESKQEVLLITQNVDHLHELAGSQKILHMHGELLKSRCSHCGHIRECTENLSTDSTCSACGEPGGLRPHVVWFGEMPLHMEEIQDALYRTDLFIAIGTSGVVYPAAGFVMTARSTDTQTIEVNADETDVSPLFDESIVGLASVEVPKLVERLLKAEQA